MPNPVEDVIRRASREHWCWKRYCTTCGCRPFREAIRRLPEEVVDQFLLQPVSPELAQVPDYEKYLVLIRFDQLPRREGQRSPRSPRFPPGSTAAVARAVVDDIEGYWINRRRAAEEAEAAARQQKFERLAEIPKKQAARRAESDRRKRLSEEIAVMPLARRIEVMINTPTLPCTFFGVRPEEIGDDRLSEMNATMRAELAARISDMRDARWRELRARLMRDG